MLMNLMIALKSTKSTDRSYAKIAFWISNCIESLYHGGLFTCRYCKSIGDKRKYIQNTIDESKEDDEIDGGICIN